MLDIKFIRENKDIVQLGAKKKHIDVDIDKLIALDDQRLNKLRQVEELRSRINRVSDDIARIQDNALKIALIEEIRSVKEELKISEEELKSIITEWQNIMLLIPNVPDISVPEGNSDQDNKEIKVFGQKPVFSFQIKNHIEIMEALKMVDLERGAKVHGFRGYFLLNDGAMLSWAIWNYGLEFFKNKNFQLIIPPILLHKESFLGTGYLPQGKEEDLYKTQDNDYLIGTSEVSLMGMHAGEILNKDNFPIKYLGFSPCFRREAGSHGKDTHGLFRVNEFYKFEQVILCEASHETSVKLHEEINRNTEEFVESIGLPYRTVLNCGPDLGLGQVKKYDIELWIPSENKYKEISSASYFHDFQTRRFSIRYRDNGKMYFAHSLNCTAVPTPRILISLVENFQQEDGSIKIPEVLRKYMNGKEFIKLM